ncbi:MAG: DUF2705 family protein [Bacillota bacterium]|jgi:hypothetical protein|nr:hypothetical protein [Bacillota bacterium]
MSFRLFHWMFLTTFRGWHLGVSGVVFAFLAWRSVQKAVIVSGESATMLDAVFFAFCGPTKENLYFLDGLAWMLPLFLLFYFFGDSTRRELDINGVFILLRVQSRLRWWTAKAIALLVAVLAVYAWAVLIVGLVAWGMLGSGKSGLSLTVDNTTIRVSDLIWTFGLHALTGFALVLAQNVLALVMRPVFAFFVVVTVVVSSWMSGALPVEALRWMPGNQGIVMRHTLFDPEVFDFSLIWSLGYNSLLIGLLAWVGAWRLHRMNIS